MSRQKLLTLALLSSLALNLFLMGGIAYRLATVPEVRRLQPSLPSVAWIVRDLSEERRQELMPTLQQYSQEIRPLRRELGAAQSRVSDLLAASEFDSAAVASAFATLRAAADRYQAASHAQTISILSELTPEERELAQEFLQRRGPASGRRGPDGRRPTETPGDR